VTTDILRSANAAETIYLNNQAGDVSDNAVIAKASGTVKVVGAEERAMKLARQRGKQ